MILNSEYCGSKIRFSVTCMSFLTNNKHASADSTNFSRLGTELVYIAASIQVLITGSEMAEKVTRLVVGRGLPLEWGSAGLTPGKFMKSHTAVCEF